MTMKESGFTLVELMLTIVIGAILMGIAVPSMKTFIQNGRVTQVNNELVSAIHAAHSESIRRNLPACFCASNDADQAVPSCSGAGNWQTGWITFLDTNGNCTLEPPADVLLKVFNGSSYAGQMTVTVPDASIAATNTVLFNSRGEPKSNNVFQQGTFSICDDRGLVADSNGNSITASAVILTPAGNARSTRNSAIVNCP